MIGANGFTGRRILDDLSRNLSYQTTGCSLHDDICPHSGNYRFIRTDICNRQAVEKLFQEVQPDVVINTSALSVPDYCETHHAEADAVNITAVEHLAECCEAGGSRFIHLSTDFVFGGDTDRPYTEEDIPAPVNYYGYTKLEGEKRIAIYKKESGNIPSNFILASLQDSKGNLWFGSYQGGISYYDNRNKKFRSISLMGPFARIMPSCV